MTTAANQAAAVAEFHALTGALTDAQAVVTHIADRRAACAAELHAGGASYEQVARALSAEGRTITRSRAQQLVERGRPVLAFRTWTPPPPAVREWPVIDSGEPRSAPAGDRDSAVHLPGPPPAETPFDSHGGIPSCRPARTIDLFEVRRFRCMLPGRTDFQVFRVLVPAGTGWGDEVDDRTGRYVCRLYLLGRWKVPEVLPDVQPSWNPVDGL